MFLFFRVTDKDVGKYKKMNGFGDFWVSLLKKGVLNLGSGGSGAY